ncbi:YkyA family protein [Paenibacillus xylanexedens]|uniref:YkyA family protein n=1 Tax=Paenibacillus xylanexedens TaxID=528191 RepID=UPI00119ED467|nr:YkyA family protein [Paenibacillus xylanexedens]
MLGRKKTMWTAFSIGLILLLTACGQPQEPAANQVNQWLQHDQGIDESLKELSRHEREDMELYTEILSKGKNKNSHIEDLLDQAAQHINERRKLLDEADSVMKQTLEQIDSLRTSLDELSFEKEETLAQAQAVLDQYQVRAATFDGFVASYKQSLDAEELLYSMMRDDVKPNLVKIKRAIRERNAQYVQVAEFRKQFNIQTKTFNSANAKLVEMDQAS